MLQVITGKFFTTEEVHVTEHATALHSNARLARAINTPVGTLTPVDNPVFPFEYVYRVKERLEKTSRDGSRSIVVSLGGNRLTGDFSAILAFFFRAVFSRDREHVQRLTSQEWNPTNVARNPNEYVFDVFDKERYIDTDQIDRFESFLSKLLSLSRKQYEGAIKAIRRYATGLDRIEDDLDVAYAMLVASIESLAQEFDEHTTVWSDVEQTKRIAIDKALGALDHVTANTVREAILPFEHVALSRRYKEFGIKHIGRDFYRTDARSVTNPVNASDLPVALEESYKIRSKYVHVLRQIPTEVSLVRVMGDVISVEDKPVLTLQGIARVTREVILNFVDRQPATGQEDFDYLAHSPGIARFPVAPQYWIHIVENYNKDSANTYLGGYLLHLGSLLLKQEFTKTDIRAVLEKAEVLIKGLDAKQRSPMIVLYFLWHVYTPEGYEMPGSEQLLKKYDAELKSPSIQTIVLDVLNFLDDPWSATTLAKMFSQYKVQRRHKNGFSMPTLFEVATLLTIAERWRDEGRYEDACKAISDAVETVPGHPDLIELETLSSIDSVPPIDWERLLIND